MTTTRQRSTKTQADGGVTDYKSDLWSMADALRGSMDAAEYKHVVLGLIFLKSIGKPDLSMNASPPMSANPASLPPNGMRCYRSWYRVR